MSSWRTSQLCQPFFLPFQIQCFPAAVGLQKGSKHGVEAGRHPKTPQTGWAAGLGYTARWAMHHPRNDQDTCHLRGAPCKRHRWAGRSVSHLGAGRAASRWSREVWRLCVTAGCLRNNERDSSPAGLRRAFGRRFARGGAHPSSHPVPVNWTGSPLALRGRRRRSRTGE